MKGLVELSIRGRALSVVKQYVSDELSNTRQNLIATNLFELKSF